MMNATMPIRVRRLRDFEDAAFGRKQWNAMLERGATDVVFLTWEWQTAWWQTYGRGELLLLLAEKDGEPVALAPLFSEAGMVYFVGSGGSDYLDFIGNLSQGETVSILLSAARECVTDFIGFVFYHLPEASPTQPCLQKSAARTGLTLFDEGDLAAPALIVARQHELLLEAAQKTSLVRHESFFTRNGGTRVSHQTNAGAIEPALESFFAQHRHRWQDTGHPSLFCQPEHCEFYRRLTRVASDAGWLRFTQVRWQDRDIAFHFGLNYKGNFLWYKPSFDIELARRSPGEVLLRQLLLQAAAERAHTFDFGLGEEGFKARFANRLNRVRSWGLYAPAALTQTRNQLVPHETSPRAEPASR